MARDSGYGEARLTRPGLLFLRCHHYAGPPRPGISPIGRVAYLPLDSAISLDSCTSALAWRSASFTLLLTVLESRSGRRFRMAPPSESCLVIMSVLSRSKGMLRL
jgi:hypothetical protein